MASVKTEEQKIEFIRNFFPNYKKVNAYSDIRQKEIIKAALSIAGYYKPETQLTDASITNLLLKAQGKKRFTVQRTSADKSRA